MKKYFILFATMVFVVFTIALVIDAASFAQHQLILYTPIPF